MRWIGLNRRHSFLFSRCLSRDHRSCLGSGCLLSHRSASCFDLGGGCLLHHGRASCLCPGNGCLVSVDCGHRYGGRRGRPVGAAFDDGVASASQDS